MNCSASKTPKGQLHNVCVTCHCKLGGNGQTNGTLLACCHVIMSQRDPIIVANMLWGCEHGATIAIIMANATPMSLMITIV